MSLTKKDFAALLARFVEVARRNGATIESVVEAHWLPAFEARLPVPIPNRFRTFLNCYSFVALEAAQVSFFDNSGTNDETELTKAVFRDKGMAEATLSARYLLIGRSTSHWYDPVCFDLNHLRKGDAPIIQFDHEQILCNHRLVVVHEIAESFEALLLSVTE